MSALSRICRLLIGKAAEYLPFVECEVSSPTDVSYHGYRLNAKVLVHVLSQSDH